MLGADGQVFERAAAYKEHVGRTLFGLDAAQYDEVLRLLDSCQLTAKHKVATPVNWKRGDDVIISPAVSEAEAKEKYPQGWKSPRPYIRIVPQPR